MLPVRRNVSRYAAMNVELLNVASGLTRPVIDADAPGDSVPLPTQVHAAWMTVWLKIGVGRFTSPTNVQLPKIGLAWIPLNVPGSNEASVEVQLPTQSAVPLFLMLNVHCALDPAEIAVSHVMLV